MANETVPTPAPSAASVVVAKTEAVAAGVEKAAVAGVKAAVASAAPASGTSSTSGSYPKNVAILLALAFIVGLVVGHFVL